MLSVAITFVILSTTIILVYSFFRKRYDYWEDRNVPYIKPEWIFGNHKNYLLFKDTLAKVSMDICEKFPDAPYIGVFYGTEPTLLIKDPSLIKLIMTKDFYYFNSREIAKYTHKEVSTQNLFFAYGDRWKVVRQNMTPLFSSSKLKNMFHLIQECTEKFDRLLLEEAKKSTINSRRLMSRYTMDCVCSCAFGVNTNTMDSGIENNVFTGIGEMLFEISTIRGVKIYARAIWPSIFYGLRMQLFPTAINQFFGRLLQNVFEERKHKPSSRQDFVDLVLGLKSNNCITGDSISNLKSGKNDKVNIKIDNELLEGLCIVVFAAGYETSAATLSFTIYELAKNQAAQAKVIAEVDKYLRTHNGKIEFDCITELPYLDACVDEALRLYSPLNHLAREVMEDYTLPDGLLLKKGIRIHLPIYYLHRNPEYFPEPEKFRPERFLPENKRDIKPCTYLPFGEGPRLCIGMRFAKMKILAGLVTLFRSYRVETTLDTPKIVNLEPKSLVTQSVGDIPLRLVSRNKTQ